METSAFESSAASQSPLQIELRFVLFAPPPEVFALVTTRLPEWFQRVHSVQWDHSRSVHGANTVGACSERICNFDGKILREVLVSYEANKSYTYRAALDRSEMKMPIEDHLGSFSVEPHPQGTLVCWRQHFRARWYAPAALLRWQMRDKMMRPAIETLFKQRGGRWIDDDAHQDLAPKANNPR